MDLIEHLKSLKFQHFWSANFIAFEKAGVITKGYSRRLGDDLYESSTFLITGRQAVPIFQIDELYLSASIRST